MKNILKLVFKQYDIGQWIGGLKSTFGNASIYLTIFNTLMIAPVAYVTWVQPWSSGLGFSIPFWLFVVAVFCGGIIVLLAEYKFFTPSSFTFWTAQWWKHNNPIRNKLKKLEMQQIETNRKLDELIKLYGGKTYGKQ